MTNLESNTLFPNLDQYIEESERCVKQCYKDWQLAKKHLTQPKQARQKIEKKYRSVTI